MSISSRLTDSRAYQDGQAVYPRTNNANSVEGSADISSRENGLLRLSLSGASLFTLLLSFTAASPLFVPSGQSYLSLFILTLFFFLCP